MQTLFIFIWIYAAFIAMGFWESSVEGRKAWDKGKVGWKIKIGKYVVLTRYHFYLCYVMIPLMLSLPLVIYGWNTSLVGILFSAYITGLAIEDLTWYIVNPVVKFKEINTKFASYYPRLKIGSIRIPTYYLTSIFLALLSWYFIWK